MKQALRMGAVLTAMVFGAIACGGEEAPGAPAVGGSAGAGLGGGAGVGLGGGAGLAGSAGSGGSGKAGSGAGAGPAGGGGLGGVGPGLTAENVAGTIAPGEQVVIQWDGVNSFGSAGPQLVLFDAFEGGAGAQVPVTSPEVGAWSQPGGSTPLYSDEVARSGHTSMLAWDVVGQHQRQLQVDFAASSEFFLSYWVRLPPGSHFPGETSGVGAFSTDSSWKFAWLMDGGDAYKSDDVYDQCLPTHIGNGNFSLAGNDGNWASVGKKPVWWDWYEWIRITIWGRAPAQNKSSANADAFFQTVSKNAGWARQSLSNAPMFQGGTEQFTRLNVPGWIRTGKGGDKVRPHYDDVYFAVGDGAAARVEIGDAPSYEKCTNLALAVPVAWSSEQITVVLQGNNDLASFAGAYLFIHDANDELVGSPRPIVAK